MKRGGLLLLLLILLLGKGYKATAQYYFYDNNSYYAPVMYEVGASVGTMNCLTDIGGRKGLGKPFVKDLNIGNAQLNGSLYLTATYKESFALRIEGTFGSIKAYDSILIGVNQSVNGRYERNLNFKSSISEIAVLAEIHPFFIFGNYVGRDVVPPLWSPYIIAGIGYFHFNPQAKNRNGQYVDLQTLSTEGQGFVEYPDRKPYKLSQLNFPLGLGVRYDLAPSVILRAEILNRITTTDYLDDVSTRYINSNLFASNFTGMQLINALDLSTNDRHNPGGPTGEYRKTSGGIRGNPKDNDSYFSFNIKVGYSFGRQKIRRN